MGRGNSVDYAANTLLSVIGLMKGKQLNRLAVFYKANNLGPILYFLSFSLSTFLNNFAMR